jgi:hypothetical protein
MFLEPGRGKSKRSSPEGQIYNYLGMPAFNYLGTYTRALRIYTGCNSFPFFPIQRNWGSVHRARQPGVLASVSAQCRMTTTSYINCTGIDAGPAFCGRFNGRRLHEESPYTVAESIAQRNPCSVYRVFVTGRAFRSDAVIDYDED